ncbi:MAG: hypothetical protein AB7O65_14940, partial [Candidatus Korobacteraceae bacterium]
TVRANAALGLVRFGDDSGRAELVRMLAPAHVTAPQQGRVLDLAAQGTAVREGGLLAMLDSGSGSVEVRSPIVGRVRSLGATKDNTVIKGAELAIVDPAADQVWEALRGLYLIGGKEDLTAVRAYLRPMPEMPDRVRQQALLTEKAILDRASGTPPPQQP